MNIITLFKLGRISNLPTVWTNSLTGAVLMGSTPQISTIVPVILALSLFYIGGMFLNDAFDAEFDKIERPERPIPSGLIRKSYVFFIGYLFLAIGILTCSWIGQKSSTIINIWPALCSFCLACLIILYNWHHKGNPLSPLIMGLCRVFVYLTAGSCFMTQIEPAVPNDLLIACFILLSFLIGLTYIAKQEVIGQVKNLWPLLFLLTPIFYGFVGVSTNLSTLPFVFLLIVLVAVSLFFLKRRRAGDIPRAVIALIAGIALVDAILISMSGTIGFAIIAVIGFALTLMMQKVIPGT